MIVGAKQFFFVENAKAICYYVHNFSRNKKLENILCGLFPSYCFWVEELLIVSFIVLMAHFVFKPFAELLGIMIIK